MCFVGSLWNTMNILLPKYSIVGNNASVPTISIFFKNIFFCRQCEEHGEYSDINIFFETKLFCGYDDNNVSIRSEILIFLEYCMCFVGSLWNIVNIPLWINLNKVCVLSAVCETPWIFFYQNIYVGNNANVPSICNLCNAKTIFGYVVNNASFPTTI